MDIHLQLHKIIVNVIEIFSDKEWIVVVIFVDINDMRAFHVFIEHATHWTLQKRLAKCVCLNISAYHSTSNKTHMNGRHTHLAQMSMRKSMQWKPTKIASILLHNFVTQHLKRKTSLNIAHIYTIKTAIYHIFDCLSFNDKFSPHDSYAKKVFPVQFAFFDKL
jgi:hypothetical protein